MKTIFSGNILLMLVFLAASFQLCAQTNSSDFTPQAILGVMQRVADWQLAHPSAHKLTDWTQGAGDAGMMALVGISGDAKYRDAMLAMAGTNQWKLGPRPYHADDQAVGQTYAELYLLYRDQKMLAPLRERFDFILAHPSDATNLDFSQPRDKASELWSWCDSLFMAPPAWMRLYAATGNERYMNFALTNWWRTTDYLYDTNEHLFFRDSTYFIKREANGAKIFWSRGNGWVMAGLVRVLQSLPMNGVAVTPSSQQSGGGDEASQPRSRFEKLFTEMAGKILACQQPDGLWRASLLDPDSYPLKETSGSGFYTYALAWGVNQGLLDPAKFEPAVRKAWTALVACVDTDGKLTHVQPIGADPKKFRDDSTEIYGTGAFLLAGSEVYKMAVLSEVLTNPLSIVGVSVIIKNPAPVRRECETVELSVDVDSQPKFDPTTGLPTGILKVLWGSDDRIVVIDGNSSRILDSQIYGGLYLKIPKKLLFQVDLAPGETRTFYVVRASSLAAVPPPIVKPSAPENPSRRFPAPRDPPLQVTIGN